MHLLHCCATENRPHRAHFHLLLPCNSCSYTMVVLLQSCNIRLDWVVTNALAEDADLRLPCFHLCIPPCWPQVSPVPPSSSGVQRRLGGVSCSWSPCHAAMGARNCAPAGGVVKRVLASHRKSNRTGPCRSLRGDPCSSCGSRRSDQRTPSSPCVSEVREGGRWGGGRCFPTARRCVTFSWMATRAVMLLVVHARGLPNRTVSGRLFLFNGVLCGCRRNRLCLTRIRFWRHVSNVHDSIAGPLRVSTGVDWSASISRLLQHGATAHGLTAYVTIVAVKTANRSQHQTLRVMWYKIA